MTQFVALAPGTAYRDPELKTITLTGLGLTQTDGALTSIDMAFRLVPWFRRACKLRANALGRMPLALENDAGDDLSEKPEYQPVMQWTRNLLYRAEMNLVKYGAAYHLLETNKFGLNATPRFIPTRSVQVQANYTDGVTGFHISGLGDFTLKSGRVVWLWEPNDESEIEPGPSDAYAALKASGLLYAIEEMTNRYMGSGGVPVTAVRVPPTVDKGEREKTETFLTRMMGGFRNAFRFLVIDKNTEFEKLGSEMKDLEATELSVSHRENVAVAIGVPPTVIDGKSANYATAQSEMTGFYMNTVIPQAEMLEPLLNTQLYQRLGVTLRFKPDELEVMQAIQLEQAQGVSELVGKPILSIDEGRAIIEYDPAPEGLGEWKKPEPPTIVAPPGTQPQAGEDMGDVEDQAEEPDEERMKALLKRSLAQHKAGSPATVGAAFDSELVAASSGRMIRSIFEHHWPRPRPAASWHERAIAALEQYNALAAGSLSNG